MLSNFTSSFWGSTLTLFLKETQQSAFYCRKIDKILLTVLLVELLLGGNGYLIQIAGVRARVLIYFLCMSWVVIRLLKNPQEKIPPLVLIFSFIFILITSFSTLIGLLNGAALESMASELKGLMYFPMFLFFALTIKTQEDVRLISSLIIACGLLQASVYIVTLLSMYFDLTSYSNVYTLLRHNELIAHSEFIFRHNPAQSSYVGFFYKGFFHLGIATLFLLFLPKRAKISATLFTITAVAFSLTRGLMLATTCSAALGIFALKNRNKRTTVACILVSTVGIFLQYYALQLENNLLCNSGLSNNNSVCKRYKNTSLFINMSVPNNKPVSKSADLSCQYGYFMRPTDNFRIQDLKTVFSKCTLSNSIIGHGIGIPIGKDRPRIEMVFLEIFYKQGVFGLLFWISLLMANFFFFIKLKKEKKAEALPFFLAPIFVYLASATNNFLTGSIGMSIVLISIIVLNRLVEKSKEEDVSLGKTTHANELE